MNSANSKEVKQLARKVDELVMQPVRSLLGDAQKLFVAPDGALSVISFAELIDERGDSLSKRYVVSLVKSGRELLKQSTR
jgi:hypothetical protein